MIGVYVQVLNRHGEDETVGVIALLGDRLQAFPLKGSRLPEFILHNEAQGQLPDNQPIRATDNPRLFLERLCHTYNSPYLRCTSPQDVALPHDRVVIHD